MNFSRVDLDLMSLYNMGFFFINNNVFSTGKTTKKMSDTTYLTDVNYLLFGEVNYCSFNLGLITPSLTCRPSEGCFITAILLRIYNNHMSEKSPRICHAILVNDFWISKTLRLSYTYMHKWILFHFNCNFILVFPIYGDNPIILFENLLTCVLWKKIRKRVFNVKMQRCFFFSRTNLWKVFKQLSRT